MTEKIQLYKCEICGNIVEVVHSGKGELVCCGQPMNLIQEKTQDEGYEKHLPVIEKTDSGFKVKVGYIEHPMTEEHYIEFIEIFSENKTHRRFLEPGDKPEAIFNIDTIDQVRIYCNVHGAWSNKI